MKKRMAAVGLLLVLVTVGWAGVTDEECRDVGAGVVRFVNTTDEEIWVSDCVLVDGFWLPVGESRRTNCWLTVGLELRTSAGFGFQEIASTNLVVFFRNGDGELEAVSQ